VKLDTKSVLEDRTSAFDKEQPVFEEVETYYDPVELEHQILQFWKNQKVFEQLLQKNKHLPHRYSFIDGPITANNPMGVHTAWGRTLKDIIQRYWAMKGYQQRFQNGFDCQGLWVEVEVEKDLNLKTKKEIEAYGLKKFVQKCKQRVNHYSTLITKQSKRLGQWMDWNNSYYTHTDNNIEHIWHFLDTCNQKGWLTKGYLPMPWCPRCGTSLSQHEQHDSYKELTHTSVYVKLPLTTTLNKNETSEQSHKEDTNRIEGGGSFLIWTTTPWTLPANTAIAVHPEADYCKVKLDKEILILMKKRLDVLGDDYEVLEKIKGEQLIGLNYVSPFNNLDVQKNVNHQVIPWSEVAEDEGTGIVHLAPGCGAEDYSIGKQYQLAVLTPIDEDGVFVKGYNEFTNLSFKEASKKAIQLLQQTNRLFKSEKYTHRYPTCWRCHEELVFRLVEEWFIKCDEIRPALKAATKKVNWRPYYYEKRMLDWLDNMGDWCILRKRYWGLPLPFYECKSCGELTVIQSKKELMNLAVNPSTKLPELHRPWIDKVKIRCPKCGNPVSRVLEVGDCWLDAGIVPYSTLNYLHRKDYWKKWFPADAVCEMREQIRLWFYAQLFMSVTLTGKIPYKEVIIYEKVNDKDGQAMHRSWGNAIWFDDAVEQMGADIMRWAYAKQDRTQAMNFGYYLGDEIKPFFLTLWNVYSFFATFANLDYYSPRENNKNNYSNEKQEKPLLDRWILATKEQLVGRIREYLDIADFRKATIELEDFVDQLSTWYLRRSRRRFWQKTKNYAKESAYSTLFEVLLTLSKLMAPITPFFAEELYQKLTNNKTTTNVLSVHLCDYPKMNKKLVDDKLLEEMNSVLLLVKDGRALRNKAELRLRQPIKELLIWNQSSKVKKSFKRFEKIILQELNVKKLTFVNDPTRLCRLEVKPNYEKLGPILKGKMNSLEQKLSSLSSEEIVASYNSQQQEITLKLIGEKQSRSFSLFEDLLLVTKPKKKYQVSLSRNQIVAINTSVTQDLLFEGYARDVVRQIQNLRKECNCEVNDTIVIEYSATTTLRQAIKEHIDYIQTETLTKELLEISFKSQVENNKKSDNNQKDNETKTNEISVNLHGENLRLRLIESK
jgi:isoleucyl-tRNA synthetase